MDSYSIGLLLIGFGTGCLFSLALTFLERPTEARRAAKTSDGVRGQKDQE